MLKNIGLLFERMSNLLPKNKKNKNNSPDRIAFENDNIIADTPWRVPVKSTRQSMPYEEKVYTPSQKTTSTPSE